MLYDGVDKQSYLAIKRLLDKSDFIEIGNGNAVFENVEVVFKSQSKTVVSTTNMRVLRTAIDFGKICFEERPKDRFHRDDVHVDFDANWRDVTYYWGGDIFKIKGRSQRFSIYTLEVKLDQ